MIQRLTDKYMDDVMKIWLNENLNAHYFIDKDYFIKNYDFVKEMLPKAEVYICKENNREFQSQHQLYALIHIIM